MGKFQKIKDFKTIQFGAKLSALLCAVSFSVLLHLFLWKFELRSIMRLFLQGGALALLLWPALSFLVYKKLLRPIRFDYKVLLICAISSFFLSRQVIPDQETQARYIVMIVLSTIMFTLFYLSFLLVWIDRKLINCKTLFQSLALIGGLAGMGIIIYNSVSVRMYGDDFYYAAQVRELGYWRAVWWFYNNWSASFFSNFLIIGLSRHYRAVFFFMILIQFSFYFSLSAVLQPASGKHRAVSKNLSVLAVSFFLPFAVWTVAPDLYKSLFWICSTMTLLPLLIFIPIYLAILARVLLSGQRLAPRLVVLVVLLSFIITTTHEVVSPGWVGMHAIGIIWFYLSKSKNTAVRNFLLSGLAAALFGLCVMLAAPGIDARVAAQELPPPAPLPDVLKLTIQYFREFLKIITWPYYKYQYDLRPGWFLIAASAGLGWLVDAPFQRKFWTAVLVAASAFAMAAASFFPGAYIMGMSIPMRTQFIPSIYLVLGAFLFGVFLPRTADRQLRASIALLCALVLFFGSRISVNQLLLTVEPTRQFAADWDARDASARRDGAAPTRIDIPWDQYEQEFESIQNYYQIQ